MASITNGDRDTFSNAEKTITDNFTEEELHDITRRMAARLREILKASMDRQRESLKRSH